MVGAANDGAITRLLGEWSEGSRDALEQLTPLVYGELHRIAEAYMRRERPGHTLSPTALVAEAFVRLVGADQPSFASRVHFRVVAARQMRRILVDHARRRAADKRGGPARPATFDEALGSDERPEDLVALDEALVALAAADERKARTVEYHYFGGMSHKEIAAALAVHESTVARDLRMAEAWIGRHLSAGR